MTSKIIIDVTEADFEYEVLAYSQNVPVVVDFWAPWCRPCKTLSPMLEHLANEARGAFRLARVDTDANPNLALRYGVRSLPTVKAFADGQVTAEFTGLQPEPRVRDFLGKLTPPSPASLAIEKAAGLLDMQSWVAAEEIYREILEQVPEQPAAMLGLAKALLGQNRPQEALKLLRNFPASREYSDAEKLIPFAEALRALETNALPDDNPLDATFRNSIRLAARGNFPSSMDGLLDILRQNKNYRTGLARMVVLGVLELMSLDDPVTRQYRIELAQILF